MLLMDTNYSKIELVDGEFYLRLFDGTMKNIFLYKYRKVSNVLNPEDVFDTGFDYDIVILDHDSNYYLYFSYIFIEEPSEAL